MRIGIDARFFGAKDKGIGRYTENLIRNLEEINIKNQYFIFLKKERWEDYQPANQNFRKILVGRSLFWFLKLKKYKLDLIHFTHYKVPPCKVKFILTVHDLIWQKFPIFSFIKRLIYKIFFNLAIKKSEKIIAVSNYVKEDILKKYKINPQEIVVIYEGVSPARSAKRSFGGRGKKPYILYVGNDYPHKNLKRLKLAFEKLVKEHNLDYQLILVTKFVSEEELDKLYRNAAIFVFPSLSEGFGLPPLEAMARGVPVVSSNATCLPEVLGIGAIYFNPVDIDDIVEKIKKVLYNKDLRNELINRGYAQIKKYSWREMARQNLEIYDSILRFER